MCGPNYRLITKINLTRSSRGKERGSEGGGWGREDSADQWR